MAEWVTIYKCNNVNTSDKGIFTLVLRDLTYPVVPKGNGILCPPESDLEVRVLRDLSEEELEDKV